MSASFFGPKEAAQKYTVVLVAPTPKHLTPPQLASDNWVSLWTSLSPPAGISLQYKIQSMNVVSCFIQLSMSLPPNLLPNLTVWQAPVPSKNAGFGPLLRQRANIRLPGRRPRISSVVVNECQEEITLVAVYSDSCSNLIFLMLEASCPDNRWYWLLYQNPVSLT